MTAARVERSPGPPWDFLVSYSSIDRDRVFALVGALQARGARVWIDAAQIDSCHSAEIPRAIAGSTAVLFFASRFSFASNETLKELRIADLEKKRIIPVFFDPDGVPSDFKYLVALPQHVTLYDKAADGWVDAIWERLSNLAIVDGHAREATRKSPTTHAAASALTALGPLAVYLVDRAWQEEELRLALADHAKFYPRRPLLLLVHGTFDQGVNEFIQRLQQHSLRRALKETRHSDVLKCIDALWPPQWEQQADRTIRYLQNACLKELGLAYGAWPEAFAKLAARRRSAFALCYRLDWSTFNDAHRSTLEAWIRSLAVLPDGPPGYPTVVILAIRQRKIADIDEELRLLEALGSDALQVRALGRLSNVTFSDIEEWIRDVIKPPDISGMIRRFKAALESELALLFDEDGVPMTNVLDPLYGLLEQHAPSLAGP